MTSPGALVCHSKSIGLSADRFSILIAIAYMREFRFEDDKDARLKTSVLEIMLIAWPGRRSDDDFYHSLFGAVEHFHNRLVYRFQTEHALESIIVVVLMA